MRLFLGTLSFCMLAGCTSDPLLGAGVSALEIVEFRAVCGLADADYEYDNGSLSISGELDFDKASCGLRGVKELGKYVGPDVGNERYVVEEVS